MHAKDRRAAPRHCPRPVRVHLVWDDATELQHAMAALRDISSSGAAVALQTPQAPLGPVVVALEGVKTQQWVRAEVVDVTSSAQGERRVGLKFIQRCPNRFFRTALAGEAAGATRSVLRPTDPRSDWRKRSDLSRDAILGRNRPRDSRHLPAATLLPPVPATIGVEMLV